MENEGRSGLHLILPPEQAEHLALKEYATRKLIHVMGERDVVMAERNNAIAERKSAFDERDSAFLQRDIAFAERDNAFMERDAAVAALELARGHRPGVWNIPKRQNEQSRKEGTVMHMNLLDMSPFGSHELHSFAGEASLMGNATGSDGAQPLQKQNGQAQKRVSANPKKSRKKCEARARGASKPEPKKKRVENLGQNLQVLSVQGEGVGHEAVGKLHALNGEIPHPEQGQRFSLSSSIIANRLIPFCSCTGAKQQCYRWGNGGWQSACCTTRMSMYPLPMNPKKRGYRLPGRKMSAGAFQKLLERLASEGVALTQPVDLKEYWAKHGTNRYVTIK